jgi:hypothetical protein
MMISGDVSAPPNEDQRQYKALCQKIRQQLMLATPETLTQAFALALQDIKAFVTASDAAEEQRKSFLCGIIWQPDGIAVNTRQLGQMTGRTRSSINRLFRLLGYEPVPIDAQCAKAIADVAPRMKSNPSEYRQWTFRVRTEPQPSDQETVDLTGRDSVSDDTGQSSEGEHQSHFISHDFTDDGESDAFDFE